MTTTGIIDAVVLIVLWAAALYCVRAVIATGRTPQGTMGWVVFLLAAPHFAVPAFLIFGHRRYPGYIQTRRQMRMEIAAVRDAAAPTPGAATRITAEGNALHGFALLAGVPLAPGNALTLLINGESAFAAIFAAIDAAQDYVLVQFYTIADDMIGRDLAARLSARARAGVRVHVLYDALGSRLPRRFLADLRAAGWR